MRLTDPEVMKGVIEAEGSTPTEYKGVNLLEHHEREPEFCYFRGYPRFFQCLLGLVKTLLIPIMGRGRLSHRTQTTALSLPTFWQRTIRWESALILPSLLPPLIVHLGKHWNQSRIPSRRETKHPRQFASFLDDMSVEQVEFIEQLLSISTRIEIEGTNLQIKPFLKFGSDSEFLKILEERSNELAFLDELPNRAVTNGAVQGCPRLLNELSRLWLPILPDKNSRKTGATGFTP